MNILQICTKVPVPPKDGGAAAVYALAKSFAALGHRVDVLALNPEKHFVSVNQTTELPFAIHPVTVNTSISLAGAFVNLFFSSAPYHVQRFRSKAFEAKLRNLLTSKAYDIVQIEGIYLCCYLPLIRKYSKAKISLRAHNVEHRLWQDIANREKRFLRKRYLKIQTERLKKFELNHLNLVDALIAISDADATIFKTCTPSVNIKTIPFGIDPTDKDITIPTIPHSIFYIGALDWIPNQDALVWFLEKVWPGILTIFPLFEFHIAGRNAPDWLVTLIKKQRQVIYCGEVENSVEFMDLHDLMVVPLFSGGGMRVKIIEAMNNGKLVIASGKACEGLPVQNNKHLRIVYSIDEFVAAVEISVKQPESNILLSKEAKKLITGNFNNLALASDLVNFYRQELS
jgi:glycosyltransferase involved in cell wall biosynthesis